MKAEDTDPRKRWLSISDWYAEFAATPGFEFLAPMVGLTAWIADQSFAAPLFPNTSHEWLCVSLHKGYKPDLPFFSCCARADGKFECEFCDKAGHGQGKRVVPFEQSREIFTDFVALLHKASSAA
ncbi:MAG TPA: hypothetical protein VH370_00220 [Humisphaera sp.]|jgi:hypothetical protein|nr:hypothetical protein [Humisphaera sp.]